MFRDYLIGFISAILFFSIFLFVKPVVDSGEDSTEDYTAIMIPQELDGMDPELREQCEPILDAIPMNITLIILPVEDLDPLMKRYHTDFPGKKASKIVPDRIRSSQVGSQVGIEIVHKFPSFDKPKTDLAATLQKYVYQKNSAIKERSPKKLESKVYCYFPNGSIINLTVPLAEQRNLVLNGPTLIRIKPVKSSTNFFPLTEIVESCGSAELDKKVRMKLNELLISMYSDTSVKNAKMLHHFN